MYMYCIIHLNNISKCISQLKSEKVMFSFDQLLVEENRALGINCLNYALEGVGITTNILMFIYNSVDPESIEYIH